MEADCVTVLVIEELGVLEDEGVDDCEALLVMVVV